MDSKANDVILNYVCACACVFYFHVVMYAMAEGSTSEASSTTVLPSILDKLRAPRHSELNRKRKVHVNQPPKGKRRARGKGANEPKSVSTRQRVSEFPKECLIVSHNKLFCTACREELSHPLKFWK